MDTVRLLADELAAVHRGRGLRGASLPVGPQLRAALLLNDTNDPVVIRDRVVASLKVAAESLPLDLRTVFLHASALAAHEPFLGTRLERAGREIDRDERTVRRRLTAANLAVATHLLRGARPASPANASYVEVAHSTTDLREPRPLLTNRKTLNATQGGITVLHEQFALPQSGEQTTDPEIAITAGGELLRWSREGASVWSYDVALPHPLAVGELHTVEVQVRIPEPRLIRPYAVMIPLRPCREFRCTTYFGEGMAAAAWVIEAALPASLDDAPPGPADWVTGDEPELDRTFTGLSVGLAYGMRWLWAADAPV